MRFLILDYDYFEFEDWLLAQHPGLAKQPYEEQMRVRMEKLFCMADFYSSNLRKLGHEAYDDRPVNELLQRAWAREHGIRVSEWSWQFRWRRRIVPWISLVRNRKWMYEVLLAQIKHYKPDVLINLAMAQMSSRFLKEIKPYVRLVIGQHAATTLSETEEWDVYDLMISSFPPTVGWFRSRGISAELFRLGFEPSVLSHLKNGEKNISISFIGSFSSVHSTRVQWLEELCNAFQINVWSPNMDHLAASSIRRSYVGPAWGKEMYQLLQNSLITLNHHGNVPPYANNCRLFEATGVGTLLITDWKENLHEMFEPGKEVVAYRTPEECVELIRYYLEHGNEREAIARAGQERTLRDHTYYHRMQELEDIIRNYL
jgi:spore maturation protein CgeB